MKNKRILEMKDQQVKELPRMSMETFAKLPKGLQRVLRPTAWITRKKRARLATETDTFRCMELRTLETQLSADADRSPLCGGERRGWFGLHTAKNRCRAIRAALRPDQ